MKAMFYTEYGTPDVIELRDVHMPQPKDNEVLIQVHTSSINSWDWDLLRGLPYLTRLGGILKPKYNILGADIAGQVEAVGKNVTLFRPGDEVFGDISGCGWGGFAEYVCARADALTLKPASITYEEAAAIPQAAVLALQGLRQNGRVLPGQKVLIHGAGGGVGTFAVQLAKLARAKVTAVDSASKLAMLTSLGADEVIDYQSVDYTQAGQSYDLIFDVVGKHSMSACKRTLGEKGRYVMIGGATGRIAQCMLTGPWISIVEGKRMGLLLHKPNPADQQSIAELCVSGQVNPVIDREYPLSEVAEALRYFGEGQHQGKVIIRVS